MDPGQPDEAAPGEVVFRVRGTRQAGAGARRGADADAGGGTQRVVLTPGDAATPVTRGPGDPPPSAVDTHTLRARCGRDLVRVHLPDDLVLHLHPLSAALLLGGAPMADAVRRGLKEPAAARVPAIDVSARLDGPAMGSPAGTAAAASGGPGHAGATRGLATEAARWLAVRAIDIVAPDLKTDAVRATAQALVAAVDAQVRPGVYAMPRQGPLTPFRAQGRQPLDRLPATSARRPILVLIHGTFVETSSTFGALWAQPDAVSRLFQAYGPAVYALDHPTLAQSPVENALTLAEALPDEAELHLLTHSRGGLVAEVLARVAVLESLDDAARAACETPQARAALEQLHATLRSKRVKIQRVLRVACPARGTLLAGGRLDLLLSVLTWLLRLAGAPVAAELVAFLDAVARQRTEPGVVPGLQAMLPDSALVRWLNVATAPVPGVLRVVAGDLSAQGASGVMGLLKTLLADAYYRTDNDIVVHTGAMYGGAPRAGEASFVLDRSPQASHFDYFRQPRTRQAILDGLTQDRAVDFRPIGPLSWRGEAGDGLRGEDPDTDSQRRPAFDGVRGTRALTRAPSPALTRGEADGASSAAPPKPVVIVLPGLLGSNLARRGNRIWLGLRLLGGLDELAWSDSDDRGIAPDGPIARVYNRLLANLQRSHEVVAFDFDWRAPLPREAQRLAHEVQAQLERRPDQPVRLLAHSMGGVLARVMALEQPSTWAAMMAREGARLVMLGTPNGGSWAPMQVLSGDDPFGNLLVNWGAPLSGRRARQMMAEFPGFMSLQAGLTDASLGLARETTWRRLADADFEDMRRRSWWHDLFSAGDGQAGAMLQAQAWGVPTQAVLDQAVALRRRLDEQAARFADDPTLGARCCLVVGRAEHTADGFEEDAQQGFVYREAARGGDGRVALQDACLPGVPTWQAGAAHGDLPSEPALFDAYRELLDSGRTALLPSLEPARPAAADPARRGISAGVATTFRPARAPDPAWPSPHPADALARPAEAPPDAAALRVQVVNGNLRDIGCPLFIGHYVSMTLTGAERAVDRLIGGTLSTALGMKAGLYPEAPGSFQIFPRVSPPEPGSGQAPSAAIVVGLGQEGRLRPRDLEATVQRGVLGWLQRCHEMTRSPHAGTPPAPDGPIVVAATLIGSGGYGISAGASARSIAQAVVQANEKAAGAGWPTVAELRFIELYMDRAAEAWRELKLAVDDDVAPPAIVLDPLIGQLRGARRRPLDGSYRGADYDLVRISGLGDGRIEFALDTRRARSEVREQTPQASLLGSLVQSVASSDASDPRLGQTLFRLLVPPSLEPYLSGDDRLLLDVDDGTAMLPWELLDPGPDPARDGGRREPWAIRAGLLRTLQTPTEPPTGHRDARADDAVLVIGAPQVTRSGFGELPGALAEAEAVRQRFESRADLGIAEARSLPKADALSVIHTLLERDWRVIHVAGHGEWLPGQGDQPSRGGIVLSGEACWIGPAEIRAMRAVPELVFVNCCELGRMEGDADAQKAQAAFARGQFAAGVAQELIRLGVRCVVAAGWSVGDEAARVFATTFYDRLLDGYGFGDAVSMARRAAWQAENQGEGGNTWAAYQCYGDPEWRLVMKTPQSRDDPQATLADRYVSIASAPALTLALETLVLQAEGRADGPTALEDVVWLEQRFGEVYGDIGAVAEAFALAYEAQGQTEEARRWDERAWAAPDGTATLRVARRLGKLRPRPRRSGAR